MPDASVGWHPHPEVWLLVGVMATSYAGAVRWIGPRYDHPEEPAIRRGQVVAFSLGLAALWVGADWPVHEWSEERLLSVHMGQHLLFTLVAPPLLLLGTPGWLFRRLLPGPLLGIVRQLGRPVPALLLFNALIAVTHWPPVVALSLRSEAFHFAVHAALFGSAVVMWLPVLSPILEIRRLSYPGQMLYLFLQSVVPTVPASFLTFGSTPLYAFYAEAAPLAGIDAVTDQRIAGLAMKLLGGAILWIAIGIIFFHWHSQEQRAEGDTAGWTDIERELDRAGLRR